MKHLLVSTAMLTLLAGAAFAATGDDPATNHAAPSSSQDSASLLDNLLDNAANLSASLSNVAENLNHVDGSINVTTSRSFDGVAAGIDALNGLDFPFQSYSQTNANVFARDLPDSVLRVLDPTILALGDLSTTAIGAMQSGSITGTINATGIVDRVSTTAEASTTSATAMADSFGGISDLVSFQNIAVNSGDVNGSVQLALNDVNATIGKIGTTAIGAMGSGSLTATISGNMAHVDNSAVGIINALVGTTPPSPPPGPTP
ncbi:hypothetical protein NX862_17405 [Rhodobacter sp. KR11]|uniref:hypothetical protein n=1 Tax=Rhodobacter sp. KR11 TaxID=2974588 RepID=UPI0022237B42|nr:hypothetical protein [Rhodobacter sp. KR11]MCW1920538.1 hypothetical protein [Rhodobacter sp. KR11]